MTNIYFVRHAQFDLSVKIDEFRPLTDSELNDGKEVTKLLKARDIDFIISSTDTI